MSEIIDEGKVWFKGTPGPTYAIKVDDNHFVIGKTEDDILERWIDGDKLCVDLHDKAKKVRTARCFPVNLVGKTDASLFSGFEKTKHAAVKVVLFEEEGVQNYTLKGDDYIKANAANIDVKAFWSLAGF
jgi:hypothetical protein